MIAPIMKTPMIIVRIRFFDISILYQQKMQIEFFTKTNLKLQTAALAVFVDQQFEESTMQTGRVVNQ